jgi:hypothetical protein
MPLFDVIRTHVFAAARIHADDTTVPVLAKGRTRRMWTYVRDDRPFAGPDPPAAVFFYSPDRGGEHPQQYLAGYTGLMQADAYASFGRLYEADRQGGPITEAACWAHSRRKSFDLARLSKAPIAAEAVKRIDALFAVERGICACARSTAARLSANCRCGCASNVPTSRSTTTPARRSTICSSVGMRSPASSMTVASAYRTTPPNVSCGRRRPAGLARGHAHSVAGSPCQTPQRTAALELASAQRRCRSSLSNDLLS